MQTSPSSAILASPIGNLRIDMRGNKVLRISFLGFDPATELCAEPSCHPLYSELQSYFKDRHHRFSVPLDLVGTPFQQSVWQALTEIPRGTTLTYGELAKRLDTSPRAVGNACRNNPIPIIVPCHRIVGRESTGGFAGKTDGSMMDIKHWLLAHEKGV